MKTSRIVDVILSMCLGLLMVTGARAAESGVLSSTEFNKIAATHETADAHQKLAQHYRAHAAMHEADAVEHEKLASIYAKNDPELAKEATHYAGHSREAAEAMRNLAKIHDQLAKEHPKKK